MDLNSTRLRRITKAFLIYATAIACGLAIEIGLGYLAIRDVAQEVQRDIPPP